MLRKFTRGGQRPRPGPDANWHTGSDSPVKISESIPTVLAPRGPAGQRLTPRRQNLVAPESNASQTVLVPIPIQWRRQMSRGFDNTWLLAQVIPSCHAGQTVAQKPALPTATK